MQVYALLYGRKHRCIFMELNTDFDIIYKTVNTTITFIHNMKKIIAFCFAAIAALSFASADAAVSQEVSVSAAKPKKEYKTVVYNVHLHCENCVKKVNENISFEKGVKALDVSLENQTVKITYDPGKTDEAKLKAAIEKLGYEVHSDSDKN